MTYPLRVLINNRGVYLRHFFQWKVVIGNHLSLVAPLSNVAIQNPTYVVKRLKHKSANPQVTRTVSKPVQFVNDSNVFSDTEFVADDACEYNVRNILYNTADDIILLDINACASVDELFGVMKGIKNVDRKHLCQCILVLWDLQKIYNESYIEKLNTNDIDFSPEHMLSQYVGKLHQHRDFRKILELLNDRHAGLTVDEATCSLLYLKKMGLPLSDPIMMSLLNHCEMKIRNKELLSNMFALTQFTAVIDHKNYYEFLPIVIEIIPTIVSYVEKVDTPQHFRLVTLLYQNTHHFITTLMLDLYKEKFHKLLSEKILTASHYDILLKVTRLLNSPPWFKSNGKEVKHICELITDEIPNMSANHIISLQKLFQTHLEPATHLDLMNKKSTELLSQLRHDESLSAYMKVPYLLYNKMTSSPPESRTAYEELTKQYMGKIYPSTLNIFYQILRYLKSSNNNLYDQFWNKTIQFLLANRTEDYIVLRFSHKYMYFKNNERNMYRNKDFEVAILNIFKDMLNDRYTSIFPRKFVKMASFFFAYGLSNAIPICDIERIIEHLEVLAPQLDCHDCLTISKGLKVSSTLLSGKYTSPLVAYMLMRVEMLLTNRINELAGNKHMALADVNALVKCHVNVKTNFDSDAILSQTLLKKYASSDSELNSHVLRDAVHNLLMCSTIIPSVFERICDYITERGNFIMSETINKALHVFHTLGYTPKDNNMMKIAIAIIDRDKEIMNTLGLLQSCTALSYYDHLPESLVKYIFSISFMERLDTEVATCYLKHLYPARIRKQLMILNRSVCLEMPQHQIPWFHENYLQRQISNLSNKNFELREFEKDVYQSLTSLLPNSRYLRRNTFSPYGYKIDFLLNFDHNGQILPCNSSDKPSTRLAILLFNKSNYCKVLTKDSSESNLQYTYIENGAVKTRRKHLEIMGYKVAGISSTMWNSMYMTEPNAKLNYLNREIMYR